MAVNESRSMNQDLRLGVVDGKYKSLTPDRGGEVDPTAAVKRMHEVSASFPTGEQYSITDRPSFAVQGI